MKISNYKHFIKLNIIYNIQLNLEIKRLKQVKIGQKLLDSAKRSTTDAIKTGSKRVIQKAAVATGDLIGNKIADKKTNASKTHPRKMMMLIAK